MRPHGRTAARLYGSLKGYHMPQLGVATHALLKFNATGYIYPAGILKGISNNILKDVPLGQNRYNRTSTVSADGG